MQYVRDGKASFYYLDKHIDDERTSERGNKYQTTSIHIS